MKTYQFKKFAFLLFSVSTMILTGCNGGSSSNSTQVTPRSYTADFSNTEQYATPSDSAPATLNGNKAVALSAATPATCFQVADVNIPLAEWWVSGTFKIKNICSSNQTINGLQIRISSLNYALSASSFSINSVSGVNFPAPVYWAPTNSTTTTVASPDGQADLMLALATDKTGYVAPNSSAQVSFGYNPLGKKPGVFTSLIDGATAIKNGAVNVKIDTTMLKSVCSSSNCNIPIRLIGQNGLFDQVIATVSGSNAGTILPVSVSGLNPGVYQLTIANSALPANTTFTATNPVDIIAEQTATDEIQFKVTDPVVKTGTINYTISKPAGITLASNSFQVTLVNSNNTQVVGGSATASFNQPFSFSNIEAGKYYLTSYGLADAINGIYYDPLNFETVVNAGNTTVASPSFIKSVHTPIGVTVVVTGLDSLESAIVTLTDNFAGKRFTFNSFKIYNGNNPLNLLPGDVVTMNVTASSKYNAITPITYTVPAASGGQLTINFVQPLPNPEPVSNVDSYDYISPFKDYNNKIVLSVNKLTSAKNLEFTSNFIPSVGWGYCFGYQVDSLNFVTTNSGTSYLTKVTPKDSTKTLDLTKTCDIMGTNSGEAIVLPGVVDPIVTSVKITKTDNQAENLPIAKPCAVNNCKDPANGYVNAGYYAQWSVWGRQYNPYKMPFDSINDIIYAFIGFTPSTGSIKSLDTSADSWGMSAVSRSMLQYPYMKAHLSFGGWTNNGATTAPMFETLASNPASMDTFAKEAVALMRKTRFSGIDIDWEWWSDYGNNVAPAKKMLAFYKVLRAELDNAGTQDGKKYTLTIAVNGGVDRIMAMQSSSNPNSVANFWAQVGSVVDQVNVMNYDYHGSWDVNSPAYFHSAYDFPNTSSYRVGKEEGWSVKASIAAYIANGVPAKKLVIGIPLYVRSMKVSAAGTTAGLFQNVTGAGIGDYEAGILDYKCLLNPINEPVTGCSASSNGIGVLKDVVFHSSATNSPLFNQYGAGAYQPWAFHAATNTFFTYDDVWSAREKAKAAKASNLGGTMFWELDGDSVNPSTSIVKAVQNELSN